MAARNPCSSWKRHRSDNQKARLGARLVEVEARSCVGGEWMPHTIPHTINLRICALWFNVLRVLNQPEFASAKNPEGQAASTALLCLRSGVRHEKE